MNTLFLKVIGSVLLIIIGFWKFKMSKKKQKSDLADEAKKKIDEAKKNNDMSGITAGIDRINRL